jgi:glycosyltransferase involved in cell wall biosynthesis
MPPLVSILIPAYNAERWVADTIRSALEQTWPRKEIIIVDDGSTDQTLSIARQFASKGVLVVTQPNQGASAARNKALSLCQGDYIQWLDADDLLSADKITTQMKAAEKCQSKRTLLSSAWGYFIYRVNKVSFVPTPLWSDLSPVEWLLRKMGQNLHMQTATWLVSRELMESAGPWDIRLWKDNDGEYFCRVILASDGIRFVPEARTFYRMSGFNSVTHIGRSSKKLESQFLSMQLHVKYLRSLEESERVRAACLSYLQARFLNYYPNRRDIVNQLEQLATNLGGQLRVPRLSWKYAWIQKTFGWRFAKEVQLVMRRCKDNLLRSWDKGMYYLESRIA